MYGNSSILLKTSVPVHIAVVESQTVVGSAMTTSSTSSVREDPAAPGATSSSGTDGSISASFPPQTSGGAPADSTSPNTGAASTIYTSAPSPSFDPSSGGSSPASASSISTQSLAPSAGPVSTPTSDSIPLQISTLPANATNILSSKTSSLAPFSSTTTPAPALPATTALPSNNESAISSRNSSLSPKVVAGISIGTAAASAIIAASILFLLLRRRRRHRASPHEPFDSYQDHTSTLSGTTALPTLEKPLPSFSTSSGTNKDIVDLLPPASDFELQEDFTTLNASIRSYVETYYTATTELSSLSQDHRTARKPFIEGLPELLSPSAPLSERHLDSLLKDPSTRLAAIRFLIAWNILSNVCPTAPLATTLLPPEISRCLEALEPIPLGSVTARPTSPFRCPSPCSMRIVSGAVGTASSSEDWLMSLHCWRRVTGAAMAAIYSSDGVEQQLDFRDSRKGNGSELTASLVCVLQPFVVKGKGAVRVKELEKVVMRGAQVGWKLFVQGSTWNFGWKGSGGVDEGKFVVFPSLVKVGDEEGKRLVKPLVVAECEVTEVL